ncbi:MULTISPECIES: hypothetical protein [Mycolicibacter]|uniref:Transmembrane protein n=2 Tax=Mycolicibacter TaxID=1073531 RepID=A0ABU5XQP5_9MYCO|nr:MULTISPECIES: hypothetical protein [unclassified Mycolicibacter]MEB3023411.1 hypothetical protein [Mycolicibacter sp. MYC098]MEB3033753.1 hypothetical protein [Mycolicibacter sp. MYC340]
MNTLLELAHAHANYVAATASAGATGHLAFSSTRKLRRRVLRPLQAVRRALKGLLFYALGLSALWLIMSYIVQVHPAS